MIFLIPTAGPLKIHVQINSIGPVTQKLRPLHVAQLTSPASIDTIQRARADSLVYYRGAKQTGDEMAEKRGKVCHRVHCVEYDPETRNP